MGYSDNPNPMVRSVYTSDEMEEDLSIAFDLMDGIRQGHFGVRSLCTSANMEEDLSITFDLVDEFRHIGGHFEVA